MEKLNSTTTSTLSDKSNASLSAPLRKSCLKRPLKEEVTNKNHDDEKETKKLRFKETAKVILIPCRDEYKKLGLNRALWWTGSDYSHFKSSTADEIYKCMSKYHITGKEAIQKLYHPDNLSSKDEEGNDSINNIVFVVSPTHFDTKSNSKSFYNKFFTPVFSLRNDLCLKREHHNLSITFETLLLGKKLHRHKAKLVYCDRVIHDRTISIDCDSNSDSNPNVVNMDGINNNNNRNNAVSSSTESDDGTDVECSDDLRGQMINHRKVGGKR